MIKYKIFLLAVLLVFVLQNAHASIITNPIDGIIYELYDLDETHLTGRVHSYDGKTQNVRIIKNLPYDNKIFTIDDSYFTIDNQTELYSVDLMSWGEDGVENFKFNNCPNLTDVTLPANIRAIAREQFYNCPKLDVSSILKAPNLESVGYMAFALEVPTYLGDLEVISSANFDYTVFENRLYTNLVIGSDINIELSSAKSITSYGFNIHYLGYDYSGEYPLEKLTVENASVTVTGVVNLKKVTTRGKCSISINDSRTEEFYLEIGDTEFSELSLTNIHALKNLALNNKAEYLKLQNCDILENISLNDNSEHIVLSNLPKLRALTGTEKVKTVAMSNCEAIEYVEFPNIEKIERDEFRNNKSLRYIYIGPSVSEINIDGVFKGCEVLEDIVYGGSLKQWLEIKRWVDESSPSSSMLSRAPHFWYGNGNAKLTELVELTSIDLVGIDTITVGAFTGYKSLKKIDIPENVKSIEALAFAGCPALEEVSLNCERLEQNVFYNSRNIRKFTFGNQLKYIGPVFPKSFSVTYDVNFLGNATEWGNITRTYDALEDPSDSDSQWGYSILCTPNLMPENLFFNGEQLETLVLENPTAIPNCYKTKYLSKVHVIISGPTVNTKFMHGAFQGCKGLKSITYTLKTDSRDNDYSNPTNFKGFIIESDAFRDCTELSEINILDKIDSIGANALSNTAWLAQQPQQQILYLTTSKGKTAYTYVGNAPEGTKLFIDEGTTAINDGAFKNDTNYGYYNLYDYSGIENVSLPSTLQYIGNDAFAYLNLKENFNIPASVKEAKYMYIGNGFFDDVIFEDSYEPLVCNTQLGKAQHVYVGREGIDTENSYFSTLTIGENVMTLENSRFNSPELTNIYSFPSTPPICPLLSKWEFLPTGITEIEYCPVFLNVDKETCILHVPVGKSELYSEADGWKDFKNIVEDESLSIYDIVIPNFKESLGAIHYNLNGHIINESIPGIHIIVNPDGSVIKKYVK